MKTLIKKLLGPAFSPDSFLYRTYHTGRAVLATTLAGFPSRRMTVIGVTGTNGKTTTCNLLANILAAGGYKVGLATTINFWTGAREYVNETKMTTDNPFAIQRLLREMADNGCQFAIIETSSHALSQNRVWGINFDVAVFTNLTPEHLDFHRTFEQYREAKSLLFSRLYLSPRKDNVAKLMVLNLDDPTTTYYGRFAADKKYLYSTSLVADGDTHSSSVYSNLVELDANGSTFDINTPIGKTRVRLNLPGKFNIQNALAAASTAIGLGLSLDTIKAGLERVDFVPGRMEKIDEGQNFTVIVDYAHTPDGFLQVLSTAKQFTPGRLIAVFGAAGDRDRYKRPQLGAVAGKYCDIIVLTEEDPGSESALGIIGEIRPGVPSSFIEGQNLFIIPDRKTAIAEALATAQPRDTVMFLSMGAQTGMMTSRGLIPYNERSFVRDLLQSTINK